MSHVTHKFSPQSPSARRIVEEAALPRLLCGPALAVLEVLQGPLARLPLERPPPIPGALAAGAVHIALKLLGVLRDRAPGVALRPLKIRGLGGVTAPATELEAPFMGRAAVEEYITAIRCGLFEFCRSFQT